MHRYAMRSTLLKTRKNFIEIYSARDKNFAFGGMWNLAKFSGPQIGLDRIVAARIDTAAQILNFAFALRFASCMLGGTEFY